MNSNDNKHHDMDDKHDEDWQLKFEEKWNEFKQKYEEKFQHYTENVTGKKLLAYSASALGIAWLCSGIYIVDQGSRGVVTRFDAYAHTTLSGPHWHLPYPIEAATIVNVENQRFIEIGYRSGQRRSNAAALLPEALMLTKDENIVNLSLAVQYQIKDAKNYLFNVKDSEATLKQVTESVQRGVVGRNTMDFILTEGRSQIVFEIKDEIQKVMDAYGTGLLISSVNLQDAQPPEEVQNAFEDAIRAREDKQRLINEAQAYANEVVPKARGAASRIVQEAEGYKSKVVARAKGEAERFDQLLVEYQKSPKVTRKRLYLEAKEKLYQKTNKVLVNVENGNNMFYMPMNPMGAQPNNVNHNNSNHRNKAPNYSNNNSNNQNVIKNNSGIRPSRSKK